MHRVAIVLVAASLVALPVRAGERHPAAASSHEPPRPGGWTRAESIYVESTLSGVDGTTAAPGEPGQALRDSLVVLARAQLGRPYVFGGESPDEGFDCSGLMRWLLLGVGVDAPRVAAEQARMGVGLAPDTARARPGDLLVFGDSLIEHIGIYVGDGRFIHASSVAGRVIESAVDRPPAPLIRPWAGVRAIDELLAARVRAAASPRPLRAPGS